jgi:Fe2+ or Zn2+ uptake regulation protein
MVPGSALHDEVSRRLAGLDQRYTPMRRLLVETMAAAGRPLTIPELLEQAPQLPQSSAYRNVTTLIEAGVARRMPGHDDHWRFELAEDLSGHHHHHLVCASCGRVEDVNPSSQLERALHETVRTVEGERGFVVDDHRLDLVGTCSACRPS